MPLCTICGKEFDRERGLKSHMTRSHPEAGVARNVVRSVRASVPKLTPGIDGDVSDALLMRVPETETELAGAVEQQVAAQVQAEAEREAALTEEQLRRRIRVSDRLNKYVAKITTAPIQALLDRLNDVKNEGEPFEPEEREAINDSLEIFSELFGLEFEIDPFLWKITNIWFALLFTLVMPFYVTLARPGLRRRKETETEGVA